MSNSTDLAEIKLARDEGAKNFDIDDIPVGINGKPLISVQCAAAELVPTIQFGNVVVGPVVVKRYVEDIDDNYLKLKIKKNQELCEEAVAEDRKTVHDLIRQSEQGRK